MKVILQKPVDKLGNPGDTAEVADGYARNYLIPRGLAVKAEKVLDAAHRRVAKLTEDIREMRQARTRLAASVRSVIAP